MQNSNLFSPECNNSIQPTPVGETPDSVRNSEVKPDEEPVEKDPLELEECNSDYNLSRFIPPEE